MPIFLLLEEAKILPLGELKNLRKIVGTKQVKKAIIKGQVRKTYIASDAEAHIIEPLKELCQEHQVPYEMVESMKLLGDACGIDVGSAAVALLKD